MGEVPYVEVILEAVRRTQVARVLVERTSPKHALATLLRELREVGLTIVLVEHDMDFVMNLVDWIVVMDFGIKLAEGLPPAIRADARVQEAYLGGVA